MRFYGGARADVWLKDTPSAVVRACIRMLPRLEAEEAISSIERGGLAFSGASETAGRERLRQLEALARGGDVETVRKPRDPGLLTRVGWNVKRVNRRKERQS